MGGGVHAILVISLTLKSRLIYFFQILPENASLGLIHVLVHGLSGVQEGGLVPQHQHGVALQVLLQEAGDISSILE